MSVCFSHTFTVDKFGDKTIKVNNININVPVSGQEMVHVRMHWLPLNASYKMVEAIMKVYGNM